MLIWHFYLAYRYRVSSGSILHKNSTERFNLNVDLVDLREAGAVLKTEIIMKGHQLVGTKLDADYFAMHVLRDYQDYKYHVADIEAQILQDIRS